LAVAGHAFEWATTPAVALSQPATLRIAYGDADLRTIHAEAALRVLWWDGAQWQDAAEGCAEIGSYTRDLAANTLELPICQQGRFVLAGPTRPLYLPLVSR
jgi:hypothetical protein